MDDIVRIGLIGDYRDDLAGHQAIPLALERAAHPLALRVEMCWLPTPQLREMTWREIRAFDALWCVSGEDYQDPQGVLRAIRLARELWIPFLGTCLGFHYTLIEYARHVLSLPEADHGKINPHAALPLISSLSSSLSHATQRIVFTPGSYISKIYGMYEAIERYDHCNFGLDPRCLDLIAYNGLHISGLDKHGEAQAIELDGHPFFFATLYQPELRALQDENHPLVRAFLHAAV